MRLFLTVILISATLSISAVGGPAAAENRQIMVTGRGDISVEPDRATIVIGVQTEDEIAATALDSASSATAAILAALDGEGIDPRDIRSGAIRLNPRYSQSVLSSGNVIAGYQAINSVEVQVMELDRLGEILAAVVGEGANRLDRVSFGLREPEVALDEARRRAVQDGARLAQLYATAAGVEVGTLTTLSEAGRGGSPVLDMAPRVAMEMSASSPQFEVPVSVGLIELNAAVTMVYKIAN